MAKTYTDTQIEVEAIRICEALGFDPRERVPETSTVRTPIEQRQSGGFASDVAWYCSQWQNFRWHAAVSLAMRGVAVADED